MISPIIRPVPEELKKLNKMKKYRTTETHPELKEGIEIKLFSDRHAGGNRYSTSRGLYIIAEYQLKMESEKGYLEEIQEPEFTENQVLDIILFSRNISDRHIEDAKKVLSEYKELKNERK